jgi:hypothetical protein
MFRGEGVDLRRGKRMVKPKGECEELDGLDDVVVGVVRAYSCRCYRELNLLVLSRTRCICLSCPEFDVLVVTCLLSIM